MPEASVTPARTTIRQMVQPAAWRPPSRAAAAITLSALLASLAGTLLLAAVTKAPCAASSWADGRQYKQFCYTDIVPLLATEQLEHNRLPYLDACAAQSGPCDEYPVLTMYFMRLAAWISGPSGSRFLAANELLLGACAGAVAVCLYALVRERAFFFALAPALVLYAFMNWDLLAVALATGAILASLRSRPLWSGTLLGLGIAAKLYPILLVVPLAANRLRERDADGAIGLVWTAAASWAAVNLPFALAAPSAWSTFFRLNATRTADWDSLWYIGCRDANVCPSIGWVNALSLMAFSSLAAALWWAKRRRQADFPRWTLVFPFAALFLLVNKVYSPQYGLWLLPLFALCLPDLLSFTLFSIADVVVFLTRFRFFAELDQRPWGWPQRWFEIAVIVRALVLLLCVVRWYLREGEPLPADVLSVRGPSPARSEADGAPA